MLPTKHWYIHVGVNLITQIPRAIIHVSCNLYFIQCMFTFPGEVGHPSQRGPETGLPLYPGACGLTYAQAPAAAGGSGEAAAAPI